MGFSIIEVQKIYSKTIGKILLFMGSFDGILSFIVAKILAAEIWMQAAIITYFMTLVSLVLIYLTAKILLHKVAGKNILVLLRFSKESE